MGYFAAGRVSTAWTVVVVADVNCGDCLLGQQRCVDPTLDGQAQPFYESCLAFHAFAKTYLPTLCFHSLLAI